MFTYYRELKWSKKFSKKFILFIERYVSKYGTSYVQAGLWIFAFNFLLAFFSNFGVFGIFELLAKAITDPAWKDAIIQISIQTINNMNIFNRAVFEDKPNFRNVIQFFRLVGNGFLYYELIKSFRMFSRKL